MLEMNVPLIIMAAVLVCLCGITGYWTLRNKTKRSGRDD